MAALRATKASNNAKHISKSMSLSAQEEFEQSLKTHVPLAPFTTLGIGGPARYFAEINTSSDLIAGIEWAQARSLPLFVLGGGSNVVIADEGFPGLVLRVSINGVETHFDDGYVFITAGAGEDWDDLVALTVARNWAGFECLSGIPGRVGATPIQNVGAYGQEISESFVSLEAFDIAAGQLVELSARDCEFDYRSSRFKTRDQGRFIITRVKYRLVVDGVPAVRYPELQRHVKDLNPVTLQRVREAVLAIRRQKAMVIDPSDTDSKSVGSFFVNPTVSIEQFEKIKERLVSAGVDKELPSFPAPNGRVKLSAAWLIESAGLKRGYVYGNVGTSTKHALAIINRAGGTARDIVELKELIQRHVLDSFGITLVPEPMFVGFDSSQ
jgi:UDP-N-acetylmuramate dehydrogenase